MFCYITYLCDGEKAIVPASFVKGFQKNFEDEQTFEVFWSPVPDETPEILLNNQGMILNIDKEVEKKTNRKSSTPLPGYYFGKILIVAGKILFFFF